MKALAGALALIVLPAIASAQLTVASLMQQWQHRIGHDGTYFDAVMVPHGREFALSCGNHEARPSPAMDALGVTDAGLYSINFSIPARYVPDGRAQVEGVALAMGDLTIALPPLARHADRPLYVATLPMTHPIVDALTGQRARAAQLIIDGAVVATPDPRLAPIAMVMRHCVTQFYVQGNAAPPGLIGYTAPAFPRLDNRPSTLGPGPVTGLPAWLIADLGARCGDRIRGLPRAIQFEDLDRDGAGDFVLDWNALTCPAPDQPCGPDSCAIEVFLSSQPGATPAIQLRGTHVDVRTEGGFNAALVVWGSDADCAGNRCNDPIIWVNEAFQHVWDAASPLPLWNR